MTVTMTRHTFPILMKWDMISARLFTDEAPKISFCTQKLTCNDNYSVVPYVDNQSVIPYVIEVNTTTCKVFYGSQSSHVVKETCLPAATKLWPR